MPARVSLVAISFLAPLGIAVGASSERDEPGFALEHVTILPMTNDGTPIEDALVVVRSGRIAETGRSGRVQVPRRFTRLNGEGKWLMPGVADMHVHTLNRGYGRELPGGKPFPVDYMRTQDVMLPFVANGVTQLMEMSIANTRAIAAVVIRGRYLSRSELDVKMRELAARYAAMPELPLATGGGAHAEQN
jgi:imidazolonepropionase-like amidohydrolase